MQAVNAFAQDSGVILVYHHVATDTPPSTSISPEDFRGHLEYLRDNGFTVMRLDEMLELIQARQPLPERAVAITFDDGYISIYDTAFPLLRQFDMPFTLFLSTEPINNSQRNFMSWDQIREMSDAGVQIANHLVTHPYMLDRRDNESEADWLQRLRQELIEAETTIEQETGQSHQYLAYPYGEFDPTIKTLLQEEGYIGLAQNSGAVGYESDFLAIPRFPVASIYANLDTASTKFETLAFDVDLLSPTSPVTDSLSPSVTLRFNEGDYNLSQIGCFANSQPIPMQWDETKPGVVTLTPELEFTGRRWRYICTAPKPGTGRFYWYSVQWINPDR